MKKIQTKMASIKTSYKKLSGFVWFHAEAGMRYNYRFEVMNVKNGKKEAQRYFESRLGNPLYFNIGFNFVSP